MIEDTKVAKSVIDKFVAKSESFLNTDTANAYEGWAKSSSTIGPLNTVMNS